MTRLFTNRPDKPQERYAWRQDVTPLGFRAGDSAYTVVRNSYGDAKVIPGEVCQEAGILTVRWPPSQGELVFGYPRPFPTPEEAIDAVRAQHAAQYARDMRTLHEPPPLPNRTPDPEPEIIVSASDPAALRRVAERFSPAKTAKGIRADVWIQLGTLACAAAVFALTLTFAAANGYRLSAARVGPAVLFLGMLLVPLVRRWRQLRDLTEPGHGD